MQDFQGVIGVWVLQSSFNHPLDLLARLAVAKKKQKKINFSAVLRHEENFIYSKYVSLEISDTCARFGGCAGSIAARTTDLTDSISLSMF